MREESTLAFGKMRGFNMKLDEKESIGLLQKGDIKKKHAFVILC